MTRDDVLQVVPYEWDELLNACVEDGLRTSEVCASKPQLQKLHEHLEDTCEWIVLEEEYVDRDFLLDFSNYYVRCFEEYDRFCKRLLFFGNGFDDATFDAHLNDNSDTTLENLEAATQDAYLGHMVLKPLPDACVGRTCLEPPSQDGTSYPILRNYTSHLAGMSLNTETLAFQEQDTVAAACATSALWSALHKTGKLFPTPVAPPSEITTRAADHVVPGRTLPSEGLSIEQMCQAVKSFGLDVEARGAKSGTTIDDLRGLIYAYGEYGLPSVLIVDLMTEKEEKEDDIFGVHALTVTGYTLTDDFQKNDIPQLVAHRISEFKVHDDQSGPFSTAEVESDHQIITEFPDPRGDIDYESIRAVLIPLGEKIRITFEDAKDEVIKLTWLLRACGVACTWDLRLAEITELRGEVASADEWDTDSRKRILAGSWPKYIWRATGYVNGDQALDLLMDSTGIQRSFFAEDLIFHAEDLKEAFGQMLSNDQTLEYLRTTGPFNEVWIENLKAWST